MRFRSCFLLSAFLFSPLSASLAESVHQEPRNRADADLTINSINFGGANPGDFGHTNNCGSTVHAGQNCPVSATFTPTVDSGVRTANLTFNFGGGLASQTIAVQGTAGFPVSQIIPTSIDF